MVRFCTGRMYGTGRFQIEQHYAVLVDGYVGEPDRFGQFHAELLHHLKGIDHLAAKCAVRRGWKRVAEGKACWLEADGAVDAVIQQVKRLGPAEPFPSEPRNGDLSFRVHRGK